MKKFLVALGLLSFLAGLMVRGQDKAGHAGETDHVVVRPAAIKWGPSPPSLPPGSQMAVLVVERRQTSNSGHWQNRV